MSTDNIDINAIITNLAEDCVKTIFKKAATKVKENVTKIQIDLSSAFKQYLKTSFYKYSKLKTLIYRTEPRDFYSCFVCNNLEYDKYNIDVSTNINVLLDISKNIYIEGTGGIGKSMLMRHFFLNSIVKTDLIPIFIELRGLSQFEGSLLEYIYKILYDMNFKYDEQYFYYAIETGSFLLLFDGLDEIKESRVQRIFKEIEHLCNRYNDNYIIITSRSGRDYTILLQHFVTLNCLEFSKWQSIDMIKLLDYDQSIKNRFSIHLEKSLYDSHKTFASNPLLLTILFLTYESYAEIPVKLHVFYSHAFDTLYYKHDATKNGYRREMLSGLPSDEFRKILAEICVNSYINQEYEFYLDGLRSIIKKIQSKNKNLEFNIDDLITDLYISVCILIREGLKYRFAHRSFQEYFVAIYIRDLSDSLYIKICKYLIENNKTQSIQDNTLLMLYDMTPDRFEYNVIIPILDELESEKNELEDFFDLYLRKLFPKFFPVLQNGEFIRFSLKKLNIKAELLIEAANRNNINDSLYGYTDKEFYKIMNKSHISLSAPIENILSHNKNNEEKRKIFLENVKKIRIGKIVNSLTTLKKRIILKQYIRDTDIDNLLK